MTLVTTAAQGGSASAGTALVPIEADRMPMIRQYLRIAIRWRYVIIGTAITCLLLGLIATLLMTPQYTAVSTIEIARDSSKITDFQGVEREGGLVGQGHRNVRNKGKDNEKNIAKTATTRPSLPHCRRLISLRMAAL